MVDFAYVALLEGTSKRGTKEEMFGYLKTQSHENFIGTSWAHPFKNLNLSKLNVPLMYKPWPNFTLTGKEPTAKLIK